jgi:very-short-patch-repair endonuclease
MSRYCIIKIENISHETLDDIITLYEDTSVLNVETTYGIKFRGYVDRLGLKKKTISDVCNNDYFINKKKKTLIEKYGVDNPSKSEQVKEKKRTTFLEHYGVDNIWKLRSYREWWETFMLNKYGSRCLSDINGNGNSWGWHDLSDVEKTERIKQLNEDFIKWYDLLSDDEKIEYSKKKVNNNLLNFKSKLEKRIETILVDNDVHFKHQFWVKNKSYDFFLGNWLLLEINGTYWHCDPITYNADDVIKFPNSTMKASDVWDRDEKKRKLAEDNGYSIVYLWERDINKMNDSQILNFIHKMIDENKKHSTNRTITEEV